MVVVSKSGSRSICYYPIKKLVHFEIDYRSRESADEEKDEVNVMWWRLTMGISLLKRQRLKDNIIED